MKKKWERCVIAKHSCEARMPMTLSNCDDSPVNLWPECCDFVCTSRGHPLVPVWWSCLRSAVVDVPLAAWCWCWLPYCPQPPTLGKYLAICQTAGFKIGTFARTLTNNCLCFGWLHSIIVDSSTEATPLTHCLRSAVSKFRNDRSFLCHYSNSVEVPGVCQAGDDVGEVARAHSGDYKLAK